MAIYAIGDLQGCYDALQRLLETINFNPSDDQLWFVGDLVNRGPQSAECLRFVASLGNSAVTVLGNHDLSLLAYAEGFITARKKDTFESVINASDRDELLHWLRHQELIYSDATIGYTMVHAGLVPKWTIDMAHQLAKEVCDVLRDDKNYRELLAQMYGNQPDKWKKKLTGMDRLRFIINSMTRMRYCTKKGKLDLKNKNAPETQQTKYMPWYKVPNRASRDEKIVFGHWSTLGLVIAENVVCIDTGCVWGNKLTACELTDASLNIHQVNCDCGN